MDEAAASEAVCVRFALTSGEYGAAVRRLSWGTTWFKLAVIFWAAALTYGLGVLLWSYVAFAGEIPQTYGIVGAGVTGLALVFILLTVANLYLRPSREHRREPMLHGEQGFCFGADEIKTWGSLGESRVQWDFFQLAIEANDFYLLRFRRRMASIVPKRAFANTEDEARFRQLVSQHMKVRFRRTNRDQEVGRGRTPSSSNP